MIRHSEDNSNEADFKHAIKILRGPPSVKLTAEIIIILFY